ncbi:MAG: PilX N-terminal domain-containing pilus assembly protein, partial [Candidatus Acidiferrales bacterium]
MKKHAESGIALATTLIVLFLVVALVVGFSWMVLMDQRLGGVNGEQQYAFYGAEAGLEKLTSNLGFLFSINPAPSTAQVKALATVATVPVIPGIQYLDPNGALGYHIDFPIDPVTGNPLAQNHTILSGPYQGMTGLLTPFTLTATARNLASGAEVRLSRNVQTVAIPVFQFGMFS